nr:uncharacterized protein LOC106685205 [Halyomorpha halys]
MQNVQFAVDGIIVSFCLILGSSFKGIVYDLNSDDKNVRRNIATFWDCRALLRKLNDCYGPALVIVVVFKLLQISGLIYFYLFSDLKNNWLQFLDICLPLINFILICYSCDRAVIEAQNFVKELRLKHAEENSSSAIKEEIQDFIYVNKFTTLCITGCNFFVVDMNLLFKISSVIFTYIVAIVQF